MRVAALRAVVAVSVVVASAGCNGERSGGRIAPREAPTEAPVDAATARTAMAAADAAVEGPPTDGAVGGSGPAASAEVAPKGTLTLLVQKVSSRCMSAPGETHEAVLGHDLILEIANEGASKPRKDFVFCPKELPDGGAVKPRLNVWEMCSRFPSCSATAADAGDRVDVTCGTEHVVIRTDGHRTWVTGPFGEREVAPHPMVIAPPRRTVRTAYVDC